MTEPLSNAKGDVSVCLTFDFDAISVWIGPRGSKSPNLIARGEFGEVGAHRLIGLLAE
jgi:peptidoglycan-N-acetylglucosamine deacetylase